MQVPDRLLFVDVETTGLLSSDRVVSIGAVQLDGMALRQRRFSAAGTYLVFDPGKESHPRAAEVHGWSDWVLRHQDTFEHWVGELKPLFDRSELIAAHNASFDQRYIETEFSRAGAPLDGKPFACTMQEYREKVGGRAGLDAAIAAMGFPRRGREHGALEDAWLAMMLWMWLNDFPLPSLDLMPRSKPSNLRAVPPEPMAMPGRSSRRGAAEAAAEIVRPTEPPPDRDLIEALTRATIPTATVMMWIARSDGHADDNELAAITALVRFEAERMGLRDSRVEQDVSARLVDLHPTDAMLDGAARLIIRQGGLRDRLAGWIRLVTYADGKGSASEQQAIQRVQEAIRRSVGADGTKRD